MRVINNFRRKGIRYMCFSDLPQISCLFPFKQDTFHTNWAETQLCVSTILMRL